MKLSYPAFVLSILYHGADGALTRYFDSREATIDSVHSALFNGLASCRDVVSSFVARIEEFNPTINAILSINPNVLDIAREMDGRIAQGNATGPLFCIPVLLKDNFDTMDMPTTGGNLDLAGNLPSLDAPAVTALKKAGAIILGKTNMHELALEGISVSSLGGQTINPYDHTRTPGGSSGGTGAAIASSFAVFGTGTSHSLSERYTTDLLIGSDTVNSLRSPASANSLFSFRPTRGLISRAGIMPISYTQDTIGAIARNVKDLAVALTVMAGLGYDKNDNATFLIPQSSIGVDYSKDVHGGSLKGLRFGWVRGFFNQTRGSPEVDPVDYAMRILSYRMMIAGATVVTIDEAIYNSAWLAANDVQTAEFREAMDSYLDHQPNEQDTRPRSLQDIYDSGKFLVLPEQYSYVKTALASSTSNTSYAFNKLNINELITSVKTTFAVNNLDALIYPEQKNLVVKLGSPSQVGRNGILAALTGFPVVTIPAGFSPPSDDAPIGVPIGMEILGLPWSEGKLLNIASHIAETQYVRRMPSFCNASLDIRSYDSMPEILPNRGTIPEAYSVGVLT